MLIFAFICINLQNDTILPFKQCFLNCYQFDKKFEEFFDESEIIQSPINNISKKQWTILIFELLFVSLLFIVIVLF